MASSSYTSPSALEKAYVRGLREGERRGRARLADMREKYLHMVTRFKAVVGENRRLKRGIK